MTLVELCIGLVVTSMVLGALSAVWFAVAEAWTSSSAAQNVATTGSQATMRLEATLRPARAIYQWSPGSLDGNGVAPARAFIWRGDSWKYTAGVTPDPNATVSDEAAQLAELALIEHDPAAGRIYVYQAKSPEKLTEDQRARANIVPAQADLTSPATLDVFRTYDFVERRVLSEGVAGVRLNVPALRPGSRRIVEFTLGVARDKGRARVYGASTLRCAVRAPAQGQGT
jgi:hypothetical protein